MSQFIDSFQLSKANKEIMSEVKKFLTIEKTKLSDAARMRAMQEKKEAQLIAQGKKKKKPKTPAEPILVGSRVRLEKSNQRGEVIAINGEEATVMFGQFKTKVDVAKLVIV